MEIRPEFITPVKPAINGRGDIPMLGASFVAGEPSYCKAVIDRVLQVQDGSISVDIETFGLKELAHHIKCVQFGGPKGAVVLDPRDPRQRELIVETLEQARELVFHNSSFDVPNLHHNGLLKREHCWKVTDNLIYARLAWPDNYITKGLEALASRLLGYTTDTTIEQAFKVRGYTKSAGYYKMDIDSPIYLFGAAVDAIATARLLPVLRKAAWDKLTSNHPFGVWGVKGDEARKLVEREQIINRIFLDRACKGFRVDFDFLDNYRVEHGAWMRQTEEDLTELGIKSGDSQSLLRYLDAQGLIPTGYKRTPTGLLSGAKEDLKLLDVELAQTFVKHKELAKVDRDYLSKLADLADSEGRLHPVVSVLSNVTGRMSIGNPPLLQFPAPARGMILADPGDTLTSIDWSQIEPVLAFNTAGELDPVLQYERGKTKDEADIYEAVAAICGLTRKKAKPQLLGLMYGMGVGKLAVTLNQPVAEVKEIKAQILSSFPQFQTFAKKLYGIGERYRKIFTLSGRIIDIPTISGSIQAHKTVNYHIQGGAYDIMAETIIRVHEAGLSSALYLAIHDELVVSTEVAEDVNRIMRTPPERMCRLANRTPILNTDSNFMGERWAYV